MGAALEIPSTHTVPLSWLYEAASLPIQYRTLTEVVPEPARDFEQVTALREQILHYKEALAIARKQKDTGLWGANLLAPAPSKAMGWKEVGTIFQYRRLLELGWPPDARAFRFADRFLFRLLSRDDDPALLVEFQRVAKSDPVVGLWARNMGAQAAAAALARGAHQDDPRLIPDVPFAVYWLELLARLGIVRQVPSAAKVLARLYSECDDQGIWSPAGLRVMPKSTNPVVAHYFPLEGPGKSPAQRQTDVTFRLALIARLMGLPLNVV